ncbi:DUF488 domain-containing protein [Caballeronia ptereochthonis]|uniref:PF04343 family protein n=1 Tax=Caballeronia ptereochthonis TaxID=1777144 RepID=A0A158DNL2_9BURK|nr:DUF488 domain-containing protein [Caballeronia ptereochthonis]SAK96073.1 PF04343 family protein [Caballeronia ptereochthonis]
MTLPFYTIGHSDRTLVDFIGMITDAEIHMLADVRKMPRSRTNPQFNEPTLPDELAEFDIGYEHMAALGGLRGKTPGVPEDVNDLWMNKSFHRYADYALTPEFREGLDHLITEGRTRRCVVMCSEAVWWRCHRRIIADYLIARGETVFHIMGMKHLQPASLTAGAVIQSNGTIVYPGVDQDA